MDLIDDLIGFIDASPSPYHVVETAVERLEAAGFRDADDTEATTGALYRRRGGSLLAWNDAHAEPGAGFAVIGAHTDSPNLRVKPNPDRDRAGFRQVGVEVYGGVLLNSWLDRDLGLSGRVRIDADGDLTTRLLLVDRPIARVAQLAIHLDRDVNRGLTLNPEDHLAPIWGLAPGRDLTDLIASELDVRPDSVLSWDLMFHDLTPSTRLGDDDELLAAPRIDNQLSCWAGLRALIDSTRLDAPPSRVPVLCLFDHEEVGSASTTGAAGPLLEHGLERSVLARGGGRREFLRSLDASICLSADGAHATHPNYPERHEAEHRIAIAGGPVIKINGNQRYATDATTAATVLAAARRIGVPVQRFVVRNDMPCGSTIGPITATRLGIPTVDLGVAQLSMHSARELCGTEDPPRFVELLTALLTTR